MRRFIIALCLALAGITATAQADDAHIAGITIADAWARATPTSARNGAAFMTLHNKGEADQLVAAASPVAKRVEIHESSMKDGVMRMRQVAGVDIPSGGMAKLAPGGFHVMLMGLHAPLQQDDEFPLTLTFAKAGQVTIEVEVEKVGATGMKHGHGMKHKMKKE